MCIAVFIWKSHPRFPLLLLLNRDEYHDRPTTPLAWWDGSQILGGRDALAGGTWLASSRNGRLAFLTNVRETHSQTQLTSRGSLPLRFINSTKCPNDFAQQLVGEVDQYNGFNLVVADLCSMTMVYITNRPKHNGLSVTQVSPGIHVLSNAMLDSAWPKAQRLRSSFEDVVEKYFKGEILLKDMAESIMTDTTKDDERELPSIYSPEFEYPASAIFVEANTPLVIGTNLCFCWLFMYHGTREYAGFFILVSNSQGRYGTRSTSAVSMKHDGEISFYERSLEKKVWREQTINYHIVREKIL